MNPRFLVFILLSFVILIGFQYVMLTVYPQPEPEPQPVVEEIVPDADDVVDPVAEPGDGTPPGVAPEPGTETEPTVDPGTEPDVVPGTEDPDDPTISEAEAPVVPTRFETLGSLDPADPYRMLVTFDSRGGSIHRVELNSPRYRELETRTGYIGNLIVDANLARMDAPQPGCLIQVAGHGSPAQKAGLKPGDLITAVEGIPIVEPEDLDNELLKTRPNREIEIEYLPKGETEKKTAKVTTAWTPLQLIRPAEYGAIEGDNPHPSMLLTMKQIGKRTLERQEKLVAVGQEMDGFNLWSTNWAIELDPKHEALRFIYDVPADEENGIPQGIKIVKSFQLDRVPTEQIDNPRDPSYSMDMSIEILAEGDAKQMVAYQLDGFSGVVAEGSWYANKVSRNWSSAGLRDVLVSYESGVPTMFTTAKIAENDVTTPEKDRQVTFAGLDAQYFSGVVIPDRDENQRDMLWFERTHPIMVGAKPQDVRLANASFRMVSRTTLIDANHPMKHEFRVFLGPKVPELLAQYPGGVDQLVYYGWFGWVAKPMTAILHFFYYIIGNFGIAILLLTVVVRLAMFPLSRKQVQSAQKMQELQPELKKLQERYKKDMQARSRAQQELFRKYNVNPMGGCLLVFVQLPIFLGLYRALMVDIQLRQAPLITKSIQWCSNLAAPDMMFRWDGFMPGLITGPLGPFFNLLPILTIILFIVQQKMFMPPAQDDQAAMQQKIMKFMMIFIGFLFYKVASGLCLYFIASSLWSVGERKMMPKPAKKDGLTETPMDAKTRAQARAEAREELERHRDAADARRDHKGSKASGSQQRGKRRKKNR